MENASPHDGERAVAASADAYRQPLLWLLVWAGGTAGTGSRFLVSQATPAFVQVPVGILGVSVAGALLLSGVMSALQRGGPDVGRRRLVRLLLGTGLLEGSPPTARWLSTR